MSLLSRAQPGAGTKPDTPLRRRAQRSTGVLTGLVVVAALCVVSLAVGSRPVPVDTTLDALLNFNPGNDLHLLVIQLRLPRTILAVLVGAALGLSGALMQALTRNPLAEPGILGINSGAAAAVAVGIASFGVSAVAGYVWFGFLGAGIASVIVYVLGSAHDAGTNPVRLVLAGAGLSVVLGALTSIVLINSDPDTYDDFRQWATGSLQGRGFDVLPVVALVCLVGFVLAFSMSRSLDSLALGGDLSRALGIAPRRTMIISALAVLLLSGAATAAAGPIAFVGLAAPHMARLLVGPGHQWLLPYSMVTSAIVLLAADILGRLVLFPGEIGAGIMTALIGGPVFLALVRRRKMARL
ncbi:FecCD family ABC transporter permease [Paenarthrobacter sp. NPDC089714]|uniref:FecCD family ABC transporter permease n=1 Tax=Paenarthrobacter sp. NPDC089714 TaxID=3364377 RepID=UPI00381251C8